MNIEQDLRRALKRKPAPPDLADRVLARISQSPAASGVVPSRASGVRRWLAAAAVFALVATGAARYYVDQQAAAEAERAKQEIGIALQITSEKLALVQQRVNASLSERQR